MGDPTAYNWNMFGVLSEIYSLLGCMYNKQSQDMKHLSSQSLYSDFKRDKQTSQPVYIDHSRQTSGIE